MENENTEMTALPQVNMTTDIVSLERSVENAEKYLGLMSKIRLMAIKLLNKTDVSNQGGKPYIEKSGCDKIAAAFGVHIFDTSFEKELFKDEFGDYYVYTCKGLGLWHNHNESEIGTCSSRDDFFGKKGGNYKPISEVDPTDIKKKAFTNFANRIIKKLIGLSFTWEELSELSGGSISKDTVQTVDFAKGSKGGNVDSPQTKTLRDECRAALIKLNDGEEQSAKSMLIKLTAFQGKDGPVAGKDHISKLSEKQVEILHGKLKKMIEEFDKSVAESHQ